MHLIIRKILNWKFKTSIKKINFVNHSLQQGQQSPLQSMKEFCVAYQLNWSKEFAFSVDWVNCYVIPVVKEITLNITDQLFPKKGCWPLVYRFKHTINSFIESLVPHQRQGMYKKTFKMVRNCFIPFVTRDVNIYNIQHQ